MTDIISVKIANRVLTPGVTPVTGLSVFPFERVYLTRKPQIIPRIFRHFLSMQLNDVLLSGLNRVHVHTREEKGLERPSRKVVDKQLPHPPRPEGRSNAFLDIRLEDRWTLIVPTRTKSEVRNTSIIQLLDYVGIYCPTGHNKNPDLPVITVHGPKGTSSVLCSHCVNVSKMYDNLCSPGTHSCSVSQRVIVSVSPTKYSLKGTEVSK